MKKRLPFHWRIYPTICSTGCTFEIHRINKRSGKNIGIMMAITPWKMWTERGKNCWLPVLLHFTRSKMRAHFETSTCARERPKNNSNRSLRSEDTKCWMPFHWKHSCTKHSSWSSSNSDAHDKPTRRPNDETYFQLNTKLSTFPKISTSSFQSSIFFLFLLFFSLSLFFFTHLGVW